MLISVRSGELAREGGLVRCVRCHQSLEVEKDQVIPDCPKCGNDWFETRPGPPI